MNLKYFIKKQNPNHTVLEGGGGDTTDQSELWGQRYMFQTEDDLPSDRWKGGGGGWCKPSCIPIVIIFILIFLVVLLPLVDHAMEQDNKYINQQMNLLYSCPQNCQIRLVESIPEGLNYSNISVIHQSTYDTWSELIESAEHSIDIASFYWTLRKSEVYPDPSSESGEQIFKSLLNAGTNRNIQIRIAQNQPSQQNPSVDTEYLVKRKAAQVRSLNFAKLIGDGILHTKFFVVDNKHFYIGSANMDWRSLTQVKELGAVGYNCSCLAEDLLKIFKIYWKLGEKDASIPDKWPNDFNTQYNQFNPFQIKLNNLTSSIYFSNSPPPLNPSGRTNDVDAIKKIIEDAEKFIYIAVMDYFPLMIYTPRVKYWPDIDNALRAAAINNNVKVRLLVSYWNHSRKNEDNFLKSLADLNYLNFNILVKRFHVPSNQNQSKIPYARVNHNKYMVTDLTAYIGTSNWSGDYFTNTAGVGLVIQDQSNSNDSIRNQLQAVFERDWNSPYAYLI